MHALLTLLVATSVARRCQQHRVDTLLDVRICRELDFDVCTPSAAADDAAIVVRYSALMKAYPDMSLECVSAWTMVQCSAAFHWELGASGRSTVCRRTCNEFRRACYEYDIVDTDDNCGPLNYDETKRWHCEDYSSHVEGRCYEVDDDDRRHIFLMTNEAPERDSGGVLLGCLLIAWLLWNKVPI